MSIKKLQTVADSFGMSYPVIAMPKTRVHRGRNVLIPAFGAALAEARGGQDIGVAVERVREFSPALSKFDHSRLDHYEAGTVLAPDPLALHALAEIYGRSLMEWIKLLAWNRVHLYAVSPPSHLGDIEETAMRITGTDRHFISQLRDLPEDAKSRVLRLLDLELRAAATGGAALEEPTFRKARRAR